MKKRQINVYVNPKVAERYKKVDKRGKSIGDGLVNIDVMRVIRWIGVETSVAVEGEKRKLLFSDSTVYVIHLQVFVPKRGFPKR